MNPKARLATLVGVILASAIVGYGVCSVPFLGLSDDHQKVLLGTVSFVNALLVGAVLVVYARLWLQTRTRFSLGLVAFAVLMLFQVIGSSPITAAATGLETSTGGFAVASTLCTTGAFALLFLVSLE